MAGPDLGPAWTASELASEDKHEQGDLCGIVTAGERDRLFEAAVDLTDDGDAAGRHELARYTGGAAGTAAATMVKLLTTCPVAKQDFDGQPAEVRVTPAGSSAVTFALNFGPGAVTHGALVISAVGEHLSTSGAYAVDAKSALALATKIDVAARKKLGAA